MIEAMIELIVGILFLVFFLLGIPWFFKIYSIYLDWVGKL